MDRLGAEFQTGAFAWDILSKPALGVGPTCRFGMPSARDPAHAAPARCQVERRLTELGAKRAALPQLEAYDLDDLDVYCLSQI